MKLTSETKKVIIDYWLTQADENFLEIEWNGAGCIYNWKDRVKEINEIEILKFFAEELEIKRITYEGYRRIMQYACKKHLGGDYDAILPLETIHQDGELFEDATGVQKPWEEWYQDIVNLNRDGKTSRQLDKFYRNLEKVEVKTSAKAGK